MPFSGPRGSYGVPEVDEYERTQKLRQQQFEQALSLAASGARSFAESNQNDLARRDALDKQRMQLAMTPGVVRGGSTATRSVADSPLMQGSSQRFDVGGDTYSFDPAAAAEQQGRTAGTAESTAQRTKFDAYRKLPGVNDRMAARLVYGHSGVVDEEQEKQDLQSAQAEYELDPTRYTAARAIGRGANPGQFPDRFPSVERGLNGRGEMSTRMQDEFAMAPFKQQEFENQEATRAQYNIMERSATARQAAPDAGIRIAVQQSERALSQADAELKRAQKTYEDAAEGTFTKTHAKTVLDIATRRRGDLAGQVDAVRNRQLDALGMDGTGTPVSPAPSHPMTGGFTPVAPVRRSAGGPTSGPSGPPMAARPSAALPAEISQQADVARQAIMGSDLPESEKAIRIQQVEARLRAALNGTPE